MRPQHRLPVRRVLGLCLRGILDRLLRSLLTLAVVMLAVAFFMFLLSESAIHLAVRRGVEAELQTARQGVRLLARVLTPVGGGEAAPRMLAAARHNPEERDELLAVTGRSPEALDALIEDSVRELEYIAFFDRLPVGKRTLLIGRRGGREGLRRLDEPGRLEQLAEALRPMADVSLPGGVEQLGAFARRLDAIERERQAFVADWNARVHAARRALDARSRGLPPEEWLATAPPAELESWRREAAALGFSLPPERFAVACRQLAEARERRQLLQILNSPAGRQAWKTIFRDRRTLPAETRLTRLGHPAAHMAVTSAVARVEGAEKLPPPAAWTPERLAAAAARERREQRLARIERRLAMLGDGRSGGLTGRQRMLLAISFLVCMVGIANAMLMSITERFREIATLKCLGATDRYVLQQFMMEAGLQGAVGGLLGVVTGGLAAHVKGALVFGRHLFACWPGLPLLAAAACALLAGLLLAILASIYPSWLASRMAPMEAMRVE